VSESKEFARLIEENQHLKEIIVGLQKQLQESLQGNAQLQTQLSDLQNKLDILITQLKKRNRRDFGNKTERHNPRPAVVESDVATIPPPNKKKHKENKNKHEKHILTQNLPIEPVHHLVKPEDAICPTCIVETVPMGNEITYQLESIASSLKQLQHLQEIRACPKCKQYVITAEKPCSPIPGSYAGPGLLADVVVSKFTDAQPLYRQEKIFKREQAIIPRSTQSNWVIESAQTVKPLCELIKKEILASAVIKTDDTELKVQDRKHIKNMRKGKMTAYLGDRHHKLTAFDYSPDKSFERNKKFLADFKGFVQADAANGFDALFGDGSKIEVGCNAHARRKIWECLTLNNTVCIDILDIYGKLYDVERDIWDKSPEQRLAQRQSKSKSLMEELHAKLLPLQLVLNPTNPLMQAVNYALNHWAALTRFLDNPELDVDNNSCEREIKAFVLSRKNFLFAGSDAGAEAAAIHLTLLASAKRNDLNPIEYLTDVFTRINSMKTSELHQLLPDRWVPAPKQNDSS